MSKLQRTLSKEEKARVKGLLSGLTSGRITKWNLPNAAPTFNSAKAKRTSKELAKSGLLRRHMDKARKHYAG